MTSLTKFSNVKVLVVGDVMIDRFWWGEVTRISPEAPVPIVNLTRTSTVPGGAANVAANVAGLGAECFLVGVVGEDKEAEILPEIFSNINVSDKFLFKSAHRPTTVKTRIIAHSQQIARIDQEKKTPLNTFEEKKIWQTILDLLEKIQIIVLSDYGKGVLTDDLIARLITYGNENGKFVLIDPKGKDFKKYKGATVLTPNRFEAVEVCRMEDTSAEFVERAGVELMSELSLKSLLITQGEAGMTLFQNGLKPLRLAASARQIYDVTGAGDTVIACLAVALGCGMSFAQAAKLSNIAAGLVVEQIGTTAVTIKMLAGHLPTDLNQLQID